VVFVYYRSLSFEFTYFDDNIFILEGNWFLRNPANIGKVFLTEVFHFQHAAAGYYRPLLTLSFMFDAQAGGSAPFMYHLTNMLLHGAAVCLLFAFLKTFGARAPAALALSLIFAVHPVLAQTVAWIPGRNDSLLAVFALPAAMMFLRYWENGKFRYLFMHGLFFACGLFTKESMVFFPFLCSLWALLAAIFTGPASAQTFLRRLFSKTPRLAGLFAAWMLPGVLWLSLRKIALAHSVHYPLEDVINSLVNNSTALLIYCGKILFPVNLSVLPILRDSTLAYGIAATVLLSAAAIFHAVRFRKRNSIAPLQQEQMPSGALLLFGLIWFLLFLIPSFIRPDAHYPADFMEHRLYVPLIGLLLAAGRTPFINSISFSRVSASPEFYRGFSQEALCVYSRLSRLSISACSTIVFLSGKTPLHTPRTTLWRIRTSASCITLTERWILPKKSMRRPLNFIRRRPWSTITSGRFTWRARII